ncbi:unnamed protein product, partial [Bubo scandiacus]
KLQLSTAFHMQSKKVLTLGMSAAVGGGVRAPGTECGRLSAPVREARGKRKKSEFQKKYYTILLIQVNISDHFGRRYHKPLWSPSTTPVST